jgi:hypothetical protein
MVYNNYNDIIDNFVIKKIKYYDNFLTINHIIYRPCCKIEELIIYFSSKLGNPNLLLIKSNKSYKNLIDDFQLDEIVNNKIYEIQYNDIKNSFFDEILINYKPNNDELIDYVEWIKGEFTSKYGKFNKYYNNDFNLDDFIKKQLKLIKHS